MPVLVRAGEGVPEGNRDLVRRGAGSLDAATPLDVVDLDLLRSFAVPTTGLVAEDEAPYVQSELFGD